MAAPHVPGASAEAAAAAAGWSAPSRWRSLTHHKERWFRVASWGNGRLGNMLIGMAQAAIFAHGAGASHLHLPPPVTPPPCATNTGTEQEQGDDDVGPASGGGGDDDDDEGAAPATAGRRPIQSCGCWRRAGSALLRAVFPGVPLHGLLSLTMPPPPLPPPLHHQQQVDDFFSEATAVSAAVATTREDAEEETLAHALAVAALAAAGTGEAAELRCGMGMAYPGADPYNCFPFNQGLRGRFDNLGARRFLSRRLLALSPLLAAAVTAAAAVDSDGGVGGCDSDELVVHMRGGDVFAYRSSLHIINREMWQPPLAFYVRAVRLHLRARGARARVALVTEGGGGGGLSNPCIAALLTAFPDRARLVARGAGPSGAGPGGSTLVEDLARLATASHLVLARSTFSWAAALLSPRLRTLYLPDHQPAIWHPPQPLSPPPPPPPPPPRRRTTTPVGQDGNSLGVQPEAAETAVATTEEAAAAARGWSRGAGWSPWCAVECQLPGYAAALGRAAAAARKETRPWALDSMARDESISPVMLGYSPAAISCRLTGAPGACPPAMVMAAEAEDCVDWDLLEDATRVD